MKSKTHNYDYKKVWNDYYKNCSSYKAPTSNEMTRFINENVFSKMTCLDEKKLSVLDFGCGDGTDNILFDRNKFDFFGYDCSEIAIQIAREKAPNCFFTNNINEIIDKKYNLVFANACFDFMPWLDAITLTTDIYRVLDKGGFFLLSLSADNSSDINYDDREIVMIDDLDFEFVRNYFNSVKIERLLLPMFNILKIEKIEHKLTNGNLISQWYIVCNSN